MDVPDFIDMDAKEVAHESLHGDGQPGDVYMNVTRYMADADRTAGGNFHNDLVAPETLLDAIEGVKIVSPAIDNIKKALFYGKPNEDLAFAQKAVESGNDYGDVPLDLIHAVLGIYTEAAELLELLGVALENQYKFSYEEEGELKNKLVNEAGDVMWYQALLFKFLGTTFAEVGDKNIAKLQKRFPVKFTEDLAVNRDEAKENVVFE